jgi:hypothetical protein
LWIDDIARISLRHVRISQKSITEGACLRALRREEHGTE